jgi:diguanylate cyclase (GGDEF)-like protein/PAS domain S-box-containing protein
VDGGDPEQSYRRLAENSTDMVCRLSPEAVYLYASPACEQVVGWAAEELVGHDLHDFVHPDDLDQVRSAYAGLLASTEVATIGGRLRHREGHYVWVESTACSVRGGDGNVSELQVSTRDATVRRDVEQKLRQSELMHRMLASNLPDTSVFLVDRDLRILLAEGEAIRKPRWVTEKPFHGRAISELHEVPDEAVRCLEENYRAAIDGETRTAELETEGVTFSLDVVPVRGEDGEIEAALGVVRDVTERKGVEQRLADDARRLAEHAHQQQAVARLGQVAIRGGDLGPLLNDVVATVAGTLDMELCAVLELAANADEVEVVASVGLSAESAAQSGTPAPPTSQAGMVLAAHEPVVVENLATESRFTADPLLLDNGAVSGLSVRIGTGSRPFGILSAHTRARRRLDAQQVNFLRAVANLLSAAVHRHRDDEATRHAALHDPLTGLPNRALALDRLDLALGRRRRLGTTVAALMIDLDRFKVINDSLGHAIGDVLLLALTPRLRAVVRPTDTVARQSADEFVVVCEMPGGARAVIGLTERLQDAVKQPFVLDGSEHVLSASIGIAIAQGSGNTSESLLRDADVAMHRAKERGPGRYELADAAMRTQVVARLRTENELRRALERDELKLHYQPIVSLPSGRPTATEALVRWEHPTRGLVAPLDFIPIAEETGLIIDLGRWVLEQACEQGAAWQRRFNSPLQMFVNVSGRQIAHPLFAAEVADIAWRSKLFPGTLGLEVTESVLLEEIDSPLTVLNKLHGHGLRLVLDDFGTGYSSLSYLKRFPLDGVKIDRSFTDGLDTDPEDQAIMKAVVEMSGALGMSVVAEGVESQAQLEQLRKIGCGHVQGYLLSRPRPATQTGHYLANRLSGAAGSVTPLAEAL